jgi:uncharacterized membrane protein
MFSRKQHLALAALVWMTGGLILTIRGTIWVLHDERVHEFAILALVLGAVVGGLKGQFVLAKTARRSIQRILLLPARTKFWQVFSPPTYLLIIFMVGLGVLARWIGRHYNAFGFVGIVYVAVGIALLIGSGFYWRARAGAPVEPA